MKKIVFDLDNVLLYLSSDWDSFYQEFIDKYNIQVNPKELYNLIDDFGKNNKEIVVTDEFFCKWMSEKLSFDFTEKILNDYLDYYASIPLLNTDKVYEVLKELSNNYELIAYSDWWTLNQIKRLKKYNLDQFFKKIYGFDILPKKTSYTAIKTIIKNEKIEDFIFIGDNIELDLSIPKSMGINTIFFNYKKIEQTEYEEISDIQELLKIL